MPDWSRVSCTDGRRGDSNVAAEPRVRGGVNAGVGAAVAAAGGAPRGGANGTGSWVVSPNRSRDVPRPGRSGDGPSGRSREVLPDGAGGRVPLPPDRSRD